MHHARVLSIVALAGCLTAAANRPACAANSPLVPVVVGAQAAVTDPMPLPITIPDGAKVETELDGSDSDILGMVKQLIDGFTDTPAASPADAAKTAAPAGAKPTDPAKTDEDDSAEPDWMKYLTDGKLGVFLKDIHRLHFVSYGLGKPTDMIATYEKSFQSSGGHRIFWQGGDSPMLVEGFPGGQGFAAVFQDGLDIFVMRADGFPNLKIIGSIGHAFLSASGSGGGLPFGLGGTSDKDTPPADAAPKPAAPAPSKPAPKKS